MTYRLSWSSIEQSSQEQVFFPKCTFWWTTPYPGWEDGTWELAWWENMVRKHSFPHCLSWENLLWCSQCTWPTFLMNTLYRLHHYFIHCSLDLLKGKSWTLNKHTTLFCFVLSLFYLIQGTYLVRWKCRSKKIVPCIWPGTLLSYSSLYKTNTWTGSSALQGTL